MATTVKVAAALLSDARLERLCQLLYCDKAQAVGILVMLWLKSREGGFVEGPSSALMAYLPTDPGKRMALLRALVDSGFVTHTNGMFEIEGNAAHRELVEKRRMAGRRGGAKPWPARYPGKPKAKRKATAEDDEKSTTKAFQAAKRAAWEAYRQAYLERWQIEPLRNAKVNACIQMFVQRVGHAEAPEVLRFFLRHNDRGYIRSHHAMVDAVRDAEALHTQWRRNQPITRLQSQIAEKANLSLDQAERVQRGLL